MTLTWVNTHPGADLWAPLLRVSRASANCSISRQWSSMDLNDLAVYTALMSLWRCKSTTSTERPQLGARKYLPVAAGDGIFFFFFRARDIPGWSCSSYAPVDVMKIMRDLLSWSSITAVKVVFHREESECNTEERNMITVWYKQEHNRLQTVPFVRLLLQQLTVQIWCIHVFTVHISSDGKMKPSQIINYFREHLWNLENRLYWEVKTVLKTFYRNYCQYVAIFI